MCGNEFIGSCIRDFVLYYPSNINTDRDRRMGVVLVYLVDRDGKAKGYDCEIGEQRREEESGIFDE